ncbi:hypothetical protein P167DRAFT_76839 [Morchella conica CCBAS932]|uniref:Uncharacterized protein n=1 Tax=Morchella conica CCBAS932 TaxID=1392247 RepID=A0A3N4L0Q0_9PEZI|nr:hypothetical protein P167DRAFT_76839 [Morchella conica CCBAS932]
MSVDRFLLRQALVRQLEFVYLRAVEPHQLVIPNDRIAAASRPSASLWFRLTNRVVITHQKTRPETFDTICFWNTLAISKRRPKARCPYLRVNEKPPLYEISYKTDA